MSAGRGASSLVASESEDGPSWMTYFDDLDFREGVLDISMNKSNKKIKIRGRNSWSRRNRRGQFFPFTRLKSFLKRSFLFPFSISSVRSLNWSRMRWCFKKGSFLEIKTRAPDFFAKWERTHFGLGVGVVSSSIGSIWREVTFWTELEEE